MFLRSILLLVAIVGAVEAGTQPTDWPYCCVADIQCGNAGGSGTLIGVSKTIGIVATAAHVVEAGNRVSLRFPDGYKCQGSVVARDTRLDLAAIRLPVKPGMQTTRGIRAATSSDKIVLAVGYPFYCEPGIPHWTKGKNLGYDGTDIHFAAHPFIHSGFSGGMLIGTDGYYLGSTNGYGDDYSYAAAGQSMVRFFSRWVKVEAK
jgi:S1-C subfamily serine protease